MPNLSQYSEFQQYSEEVKAVYEVAEVFIDFKDPQVIPNLLSDFSQVYQERRNLCDNRENELLRGELQNTENTLIKALKNFRNDSQVFEGIPAHNYPSNENIKEHNNSTSS